jgi:hypothetical protein
MAAPTVNMVELLVQEMTPEQPRKNAAATARQAGWASQRQGEAPLPSPDHA